MSDEYAASENNDEVDDITVTFSVPGRRGAEWKYRYGIPESAGQCLDRALDRFADEWPELIDLRVDVTLTGGRFGFRHLYRNVEVSGRDAR